MHASNEPPRSPPNPPAGGPSRGLEIAPGVLVPRSVLRFSYARSSGPGGQNINKRSTKARLRVALGDIPLTEAAKRRLRATAGSLLADTDELVIASDRRRSRERNREACLDRLRTLLVEAKRPPKVRKATKPTAGSKKRRLQGKREQADKKQRRRWEPE